MRFQQQGQAGRLSCMAASVTYIKITFSDLLTTCQLCTRNVAAMTWRGTTCLSVHVTCVACHAVVQRACAAANVSWRVLMLGQMVAQQTRPAQPLLTLQPCCTCYHCCFLSAGVACYIPLLLHVSPRHECSWTGGLSVHSACLLHTTWHLL